jgi:hypothetical protein
MPLCLINLKIDISQLTNVHLNRESESPRISETPETARLVGILTKGYHRNIPKIK